MSVPSAQLPKPHSDEIRVPDHFETPEPSNIGDFDYDEDETPSGYTTETDAPESEFSVPQKKKKKTGPITQAMLNHIQL